MTSAPVTAPLLPPSAPVLLVLLVSLAVALVAGFLMHRSDYCLTGMVRDLFLFRRAGLLPVLLLQIGATMLLLELARLGGLWSGAAFITVKPLLLTSLVGGALFGFGSVLCGSCVVGCLYKMATGSLLNLVAFLAMVAGATLYAEIAPWWEGFTAGWPHLPYKTLPELLHRPVASLVWPLMVLLTLALWRYGRQHGFHRRCAARGFIQPWRTALAWAGLTLLLCLLVGMPMGITSSYVKLGLSVEQLLLPEHVAALDYGQRLRLEYVPPLLNPQNLRLEGRLGPGWDAVALLQAPLVLGIVLGSAFSAWRLGEWRLVWRVPAWQYVLVLAGGLLTGLAARLAPGCNVHYLLGDLPILGLNALLFALGLLPGAAAGVLVLRQLLTHFAAGDRGNP